MDLELLDMESLGFVVRNGEDGPMLQRLVRIHGLVDLCAVHDVVVLILREHYTDDAAQKIGVEPR